MSASLLVT